jgi:iron complex outermembrane recepter protein
MITFRGNAPLQPLEQRIVSLLNYFIMLRFALFFATILFPFLTHAQCLVTGQVTGQDGNPLPGANVVIVGTGKGAAADANGLYRIEGVRPGTYVVRASFIGYEVVEKTTVVREDVQRLILHIQMQARIITVDELVVRATRAGIKTPMTYTNIAKEELQKNNLGQDAPYMLQWTPSAVVTSDAGTGVGYTGIRIRGADPTRINVTINGIPLNDAESQNVFWVDLPDFISSTDDVQIQRGVGASTNGAGAFGATINLNTAKLRKEPYATLEGSLGSFNTMKGNVQFGTGLIGDKFTMEGRLSRISSDGFIDRASADLESYYFSGAYMGEKSSLRLNLFTGKEVTYQAWYGVPAEFVNDPQKRTFNPAGTEKEGDPYENEVDDYGQTHVQALYNNQLGLNWNLNLALHYTRGAGFFEQYRAGQRFSNYGLENLAIGGDTIARTDLVRRRWLDNDFYGTTYALSYLSDNNRLEAILGGAFNIYEGAHFGQIVWAEYSPAIAPGYRYYDNDGRKTDFNIFAKANYELVYGLNAYLDLQFRRVVYDFVGLSPEQQSVDQTDALDFFNPKAGLWYEISKQANLYASFAVANREPNREDYTESTVRSRPRPERLYNTEVGYRRNWSKGALNVNFYHMFYRDQLALNGQINDVGAYTRINIDRSHRLGVEIAGGLQLTEHLNLNANATLSRNRIERFTEFVDVYDADFNWTGQRPVEHENTDLAFSPQVIAMSELSWDVLKNPKKAKNHALNLSLLSKYVGKQYIDNTSDDGNAIDAYFFNDLRLTYTWKNTFVRELGLTLLAMNIFDARYESNAWSYRYILGEDTLIDQGFFPQAGRSFLVGVRVGL